MKHRLTACSVIVAAAMAALWLAPADVAAQRGQGQAPAANFPPPRTPSGTPDLTGWYGGGGGGGNANTDADGNIEILLASRDGAAYAFERDSGIRQRMSPNKPLYKPELWEKVQYLDVHGNKEDPSFSCMPNGVPRMGTPGRIVQTPVDIIFFYGQRNTYRIIPIDGRPHHPENSLDQTWMGDSIGWWEGDTLVVETIGFNDVSWLDWPGYFHSTDMKVIERFTRAGDTVRYDVTVEDPTVLIKPWVMNTRTMRINPDSKAMFIEDLPCDERDLEHLVTKERG